MSKEKENNIITYNQLISICILSEGYDNSQEAKFLYAEENLDHSLYFKTCKKTLLDYSDIKGSLFYIRNIEECLSNSAYSENQENISRELGYLKKEKIYKNTKFYLQHMTSKKFVSIERTNDNRYILKLKKNMNKACNFLLRKVNQQRNSINYMNITDIYNLSVYIEEDDLLFFLKDELTPIKNNEKLFNIIIDKNSTTDFYLINQQWYIRDSKEIYSGQLINIIFSLMIKDKKEKLMLSISKKTKEEIENELNEEDYTMEYGEQQQYKEYKEYYLTGIPYTNELSMQVLNNSFWIIEEDTTFIEENIKFPLNTKNHFRIRNVNTGLYLNIREKKNNIFVDNSLSDEFSNIVFEFILVDENAINKNYRILYNFSLYNYNFNVFESVIMEERDYILKGIYNKLKSNNSKKLKIDYKPISLSMNDKNRIDIKKEYDFIFKIKRIDLFRGFEITYVKKIIDSLYKIITNEKKVDNNIINESIKFFFEYLLNIDYSFKDEKYECNIPVKPRQILLFRFRIVELIDKILEYYINKIKKEKINFLNEIGNKNLNELLINIINFFKNLSSENEEIKESIYIISLNNVLILSDIITKDNDNITDIADIATLINFIFDLINDSEALQDYILGGGDLLEKQKLKNKNLQKYKTNNLLRKQKLLNYIEKSHNYLLCYEKLIGLNKVQYKREEIESEVKAHIQRVIRKNDKNKKTYKQVIDEIIIKTSKSIKKHSFILDKFIKQKKNKISTPSKKKSHFRSIIKSTPKIEEIKKEEEMKRKERGKRTTAKEMSNIIIEEMGRIDTTNKLIDSEEENDNDNNNII